MLGIGFLVSDIINFISYQLSPDNHFSKEEIKWLKETKRLTDWEIKNYYLGSDGIKQIQRMVLKNEFKKNKGALNIK